MVANVSKLFNWHYRVSHLTLLVLLLQLHFNIHYSLIITTSCHSCHSCRCLPKVALKVYEHFRECNPSLIWNLLTWQICMGLHFLVIPNHLIFVNPFTFSGNSSSMWSDWRQISSSTAALVLIKHMNINWLLNGQSGCLIIERSQTGSVKQSRISLNMGTPLSPHLLTECMMPRIRTLATCLKCEDPNHTLHHWILTDPHVSWAS